ncbi:hypothetical protein WR25_01891 [Diploscapter pachys]|uniref:Major sperm protein n=1 Tax=Diploscapter pachys TaxID=2018661 RepID=A0A2A2LA56_9BILA|nr:hypothetical protein WR25_01891 [Diploscapter pachys]
MACGGIANEGFDPSTVFEKASGWVKERVHDERHFTARWLKQIEEATGVNRCIIAQSVAGIVTLSLCCAQQPFFICNGVLVAFPCILLFVYPEECPKKEHLTIYWVCFGILTALDGALKKLPGYYHIKLLLMLLLFVEPFRLVDKIEKIAEEANRRNNCENTNDATRTAKSDVMRATKMKSSPKEEKKKEESAAQPAPPSQETLALPPEPLNGPEQRPAEAAPAPVSEENKPAEASKVDSREKEPIKEEVKQENEMPKGLLSPSIITDQSRTETKSPTQKTAVESFSTTDIPGNSRFRGENPMTNNRSYRLPLTPGVDNKDIEPANNLRDLIVFPTEKIVFNAPFDFDNITYHIKVTNNSLHRMAFAIKCNCIPRIICYPPHGILASKETIAVAVTCQKILEFSEGVVKDDRIAIEYVIMSNKDQRKEFTFELLHSSETRCRKNLAIEYNP